MGGSKNSKQEFPVSNSGLLFLISSCYGFFILLCGYGLNPTRAKKNETEQDERKIPFSIRLTQLLELPRHLNLSLCLRVSVVKTDLALRKCNLKQAFPHLVQLRITV